MLNNWNERDRATLWHPYSSALTPTPLWHVSAATGVHLTLTSEPTSADPCSPTTVIDGMSSWWCMIHGYRNPHLDAALHQQIDSFSHVMFGGLTHDPAIELGERLKELSGYDRVFLADSGSVAVEVALKMAVQYQATKRGHTERSKFLTVRGGYHGDTTGAMSVCDPDGGMHSLFRGALMPQYFGLQPPPWRAAQVTGAASASKNSAESGAKSAAESDTAHEAEFEAWAFEFQNLAAGLNDRIAGIIVEPVLQGAGGMYMYDPRCLEVMRSVCDEWDMLLICDEIATGFGRTGPLWASDHAGIKADIMCVGKALTGGYLSLAATLCTEAVAEAVSQTHSGQPSALMHGPTFMGNPLACAAANASLALLPQSQAAVPRISAELRAGLAPITCEPGVADVRVLGAVGVVQLDHEVNVTAATRAAIDHGVWLRPFRNLIYTMPPYVATTENVATICAGISAAVAASYREAEHHA